MIQSKQLSIVRDLISTAWHMLRNIKWNHLSGWFLIWIFYIPTCDNQLCFTNFIGCSIFYKTLSIHPLVYIQIERTLVLYSMELLTTNKCNKKDRSRIWDQMCWQIKCCSVEVSSLISDNKLVFNGFCCLFHFGKIPTILRRGCFKLKK